MNMRGCALDPLLTHAEAICKNVNWEYAGALLRSHGEALGYMKRKGYPVQDVLEAAKQAEKALVRNGRISEKTVQTESRELVSLKEYVEMTNRGFRRAIDRLKQK